MCVDARMMRHSGIAKARKYAYYYFFRRFIPFAYTKHRTWNNVTQLALRSFEELRLFEDKFLDIICNGILEGSAFTIKAP